MSFVSHPDNSFTAGQTLRSTARQWPDAPAVSGGQHSVTYRELDERADAIAQQLILDGVMPGDRVGIVLSNCVAFAELMYGIARAGAVVVPFNFRLTAPELEFQFKDCGPKVVFSGSLFTEVVGAASAASGVNRIVSVDLNLADPLGQYLTEADSSQANELPDVGACDRFVILYTSGTTGRPKGAVLTHLQYHLQAMARIVTQEIPVGKQSAWLSGLQLFHLGGTASLLPSVIAGGHFVTLTLEEKDPEVVLDLIVKHKIETCSLIPVQWEGVLSAHQQSGLDDLPLRRISIGTMASTVDLFERVGRLAPNVSLFNSFGQTETAGITSSLSGEEAVESPGSVGRPVIGNEVRIVDESLVDVAEGQVGELVYRGPSICVEYWNNPEETQKAWAGGWFHSGDLARRDENGLIWIVDRKKDMIISGGENIYPAEIEDVIGQHPDVREVSVIGMPHERWGETPWAVIVPADAEKEPTLADLLPWLEKRLASYKKPTQVMVVQEMPRNANGKVMKFRLQEIAQTDFLESRSAQ